MLWTESCRLSEANLQPEDCELGLAWSIYVVLQCFGLLYRAARIGATYGCVWSFLLM
jgi:hypothetical protein